MKIKTSELTGAALDWAVAKCEGVEYLAQPEYDGIGKRYEPTNYSTNWSQGGPILERENIQLLIDTLGNHFAVLWIKGIGYGPRMDGPDPLTAAMRCYVASKLGDTVDVPEELTKEKS